MLLLLLPFSFPTVVGIFTVSLQLVYGLDWPVNNRLHIQHESFNLFILEIVFVGTKPSLSKLEKEKATVVAT